MGAPETVFFAKTEGAADPETSEPPGKRRVRARGQDPGQAVAGGGAVGLEFNRRFKLGDGLRRVALAEKRNAQALVGGGRIGIQFERLLEMDDGFVQQPRAAQGFAEVEMCVVVIGPEFEGVPQQGDGGVHISLQDQGAREVVARHGGVRIELDGLLKVRRSFVHAAPFEEDLAQGALSVRVLRLDFHRGFVVAEGLVHAALLQAECAKLRCGSEIWERRQSPCGTQRPRHPRALVADRRRRG